MENLIFHGMSGLKLEMTSYLDNAYDVTIFCCFETFLAYLLFLPSFNVVRHQNDRVKLGGGGGGVAPIHYRGILDPIRNRVKKSNA